MSTTRLRPKAQARDLDSLKGSRYRVQAAAPHNTPYPANITSHLTRTSVPPGDMSLL